MLSILSCVLHEISFPPPLSLSLSYPLFKVSFLSSFPTFREHDCFAASINYPRLTGEYGRQTGDNNGDDKRVNNTPTYPGNTVTDDTDDGPT